MSKKKTAMISIEYSIENGEVVSKPEVESDGVPFTMLLEDLNAVVSLLARMVLDQQQAKTDHEEEDLVNGQIVVDREMLKQSLL
jgi:hypothetical protein